MPAQSSYTMKTHHSHAKSRAPTSNGPAIVVDVGRARATARETVLHVPAGEPGMEHVHGARRKEAGARAVDHYIDNTTKRLLDFGHVSDPEVMRMRQEKAMMMESQKKFAPAESTWYNTQFKHGYNSRFEGVGSGVPKKGSRARAASLDRGTSGIGVKITLKTESQVEDAPYCNLPRSGQIMKTAESNALSRKIEQALNRSTNEIYKLHGGSIDTVEKESMQDLKRACTHDVINGRRVPKRGDNDERFIGRALSSTKRAYSTSRLDKAGRYRSDHDDVTIVGTEPDVAVYGADPARVVMGRDFTFHSVGGTKWAGDDTVQGPYDVEVMVLPSGKKAIQYQKTWQSGYGDSGEQNAAVKRVVDKTRIMQRAMTTLEDFVRRNRSLFPEDTRIYQRIRFFQLTDAQMAEIGEHPDGEVYGVRITEKLVVPEGTEVAHILKRCYGDSNLKIEYGVKEIGGKRYAVTSDLDTTQKNLKTSLRRQVDDEYELKAVQQRRRAATAPTTEDYYLLPTVADRSQLKRTRIGCEQEMYTVIERPHPYSAAGARGDGFDQPPASSEYNTMTARLERQTKKKRLDNIPSFTSKIRDKRARVGNQVRFNCAVMGIPTPVVTWYHGGTQLIQGGRYDMTNEHGVLSLCILSTEPEDAGMYVCRVTNIEGEASCNASLHVTDDDTITRDHVTTTKPWYSLEAVNALAEAGNSALLECSAQGRPMPSFSWCKDNSAISESDERFKISSDERGHAKLIIHDVKETDTGLYKCTAENKDGKAICTATLKVVAAGQLSGIAPREKPSDSTVAAGRQFSREKTPELAPLGPPPEKGAKPQFISVPPEQKICMAGDELSIYAVALGDPTPYVRWMKGARELSYTEHMRVLSEGDKHVLVIRNTTELDSGEYRVVAENALGKVRASCFVNVKPKSHETDDWDMKTFRMEVPDVHVQSHMKMDVGNIAPQFTMKLPSELIVTEGQDLEIKSEAREAAPAVYVSKSYELHVDGDLAMEEKNIRIHREDDGDEKAYLLGTKREVYMEGNTPRSSPRGTPRGTPRIQSPAPPSFRHTQVAEVDIDQIDIMAPVPGSGEEYLSSAAAIKAKRLADANERAKAELAAEAEAAGVAAPVDVDHTKPVFTKEPKDVEKPVEVDDKPPPKRKGSKPGEEAEAPEAPIARKASGPSEEEAMAMQLLLDDDDNKELPRVIDVVPVQQAEEPESVVEQQFDLEVVVPIEDTYAEIAQMSMARPKKAPVVSAGLANQAAPAGSEVTLFAVVESGLPVSEVKWLHDGLKMEVEACSRYRISNVGDTHSLTLMGIDSLAGGQYTCTVVNPDGEISSSATVKLADA